MGSRLRDLSQHGPRGVRLLRVWGKTVSEPGPELLGLWVRGTSNSGVRRGGPAETGPGVRLSVPTSLGGVKWSTVPAG